MTLPLDPHALAVWVVNRPRHHPGLVELAQKLDFQLRAVIGADYRHIAHGHALFGVVGIAAGTDIAHAFTMMENGLIAEAIHVLRIDNHGDQALGRLIRFGGGLADEICLFVKGDESIKAGFGGGEIRAEIERPDTPVLFQPHRHQAPGRHRA